MVTRFRQASLYTTTTALLSPTTHMWSLSRWLRAASTLILAVLLCASMPPCSVHAQQPSDAGVVTDLGVKFTYTVSWVHVEDGTFGAVIQAVKKPTYVDGTPWSLLIRYDASAAAQITNASDDWGLGIYDSASWVFVPKDNPFVPLYITVKTSGKLDLEDTVRRLAVPEIFFYVASNDFEHMEMGYTLTKDNDYTITTVNYSQLSKEIFGQWVGLPRTDAKVVVKEKGGTESQAETASSSKPKPSATDSDSDSSAASESSSATPTQSTDTSSTATVLPPVKFIKGDPNYDPNVDVLGTVLAAPKTGLYLTSTIIGIGLLAHAVGTYTRYQYQRQYNMSPKLDATTLDSNMKKNTGFIKRCKAGMGQDSSNQLLREVKLLKLEKYVSEIVPAVAEGLLKCKSFADVAAAIDVVTALHARFPMQFTVPLIETLVKSLAPPSTPALVAMTPEMREREEQARVARQKIVLRAFTEMYLSGLLWGVDELPGGAGGLDRSAAFMMTYPSTSGSGSGAPGSSSSSSSAAAAAAVASKISAKVKELVQQPGSCVLTGVMQNLLLTDKEHHLSILLAVSFARTFKTDLALVGEDGLSTAISAVDLDEAKPGESDAHVVSQETCKKCRTLLNDYLDSAITHLTTINTKLTRLCRNNEEKLFAKGVVHADAKEKIDRHTQSFDKLLESVTMLCECLGRTPPHFTENEVEEGPSGIVFDTAASSSIKNNQAGLWEDEEERSFYETVLDLQSQLPPLLLNAGRKKTKEAAAEQSSSTVKSEATKIASNAPGPAQEPAVSKDSTGDEDGAADEDGAVFEDIDENAINLDIQAASAEADDFGEDDLIESSNALGLLEYQKFVNQRRHVDSGANGEQQAEITLQESTAETESKVPGHSLTVTPTPKDQNKGLALSPSASKTGGSDEQQNVAGTEGTLTIVQQTGSARIGVTQTIASRNLSEVLRRLPTFTTKEDVDQTAVDFCYVNNRANRAALIRALVDVPRRKLYIIPFYARLIAILSQYFPEIGEGVLEEVNQEFRWLFKQRFRDLMETRLKNIKYIAELTKFKIAPLHIAYRCAKVLTEQFNAQNTEVLCSLLDGCGRFLLAQPETAERVSALLDILMRMRCARNLDDRTVLLIENACNACRPQQARQVHVAKLRTPYELFIRKLIYEDLSRESVERVCVKLRKLPWTSIASGDDPQRIRHTLVNCFSKVWKIKHANVYLLTMTAGSLGRLYPWFRVAVVDTVFENIRLGLDRNFFAHNQRRLAEMRYVGEMFVYKLIDSKDIIDLLYTLVRYGHGEPHPTPGWSCETDMSNDFFRVRLVSTLLQTCGPYIRDPEDRRALEMFAVYLQMYILAKEQPLPIDTEYNVDHMYETVFPSVKRYGSWGEAAQAMREIVQAQAKAQNSSAASVLPGKQGTAASNNVRSSRGAGSAATLTESAKDLKQHEHAERPTDGMMIAIDTEGDGNFDEANDESDSDDDDDDDDNYNYNDKDMDDDNDDDQGRATGYENEEDGIEDVNDDEDDAGSDNSQSGDTDGDDLDDEAEALRLQKIKEAEEEAEMAEARLQMEAMEALLEQEEEELLEQEFNKLVVESSDPRKVERASKLDMGIPMNLLGRTSTTQKASALSAGGGDGLAATSDSVGAGDGATGSGRAGSGSGDSADEEDFDAIRFSLLTGKRQRPVVREVNIPAESQIARNLRQQEESAMKVRANLKRFVLSYERREEEEANRQYEREMESQGGGYGHLNSGASAAAKANASRFRNVYRRPIAHGTAYADKSSVPSGLLRRKPAAATQEQQQNTMRSATTRTLEKVFKAVMVGEPNSGKTSLRSHFLHNMHSWKYSATQNPDFVSTYVTLENDEMIAMQIWDTSGGTTDTPATNSLVQDADGIFLVISADDPNWLSTLREHFSALKSIASQVPVHTMADQFLILGPTERIAALREIISDLSTYERAYAKRLLLLSNSSSELSFDLVSCLPSEIVYRIFALLRPRDLRACRRTSRLWRQYAQSDRVVGDYVREITGSSAKIPSFLTTPRRAFRWLEEREHRWEIARPTLTKTIQVRSQISALTTNASWVAASFDRYLKAWDVNGNSPSLVLNIRANSANRIAICATGRALIFSSYLREAKVYSLVDCTLLFEVRAAVSAIDHVDIYKDLAAILRRNNVVDVYNWRDRRVAARFELDRSGACGIKLCSNGLLIVAYSNWCLDAYSVENSSLQYRWSASASLMEEAQGLFKTDTAPKLKAVCFGDQSHIARVTLYNRAGYVSLLVDSEKRAAQIYGVKEAVGSGPQLLETHFMYGLSLSSSQAFGPQIYTVRCVVNGSGSGSDSGSSDGGRLRIPRPSANIAESRLPADERPDISAMDDDIVALGYSGAGIAMLKFSR
ncbi:mRNA decay protein [Coemansia sp. Benny D115]|nr:mRNA decay protein [Coemansia sp. Benny D115]